jgi:hypothetical protein
LQKKKIKVISAMPKNNERIWFAGFESTEREVSTPSNVIPGVKILQRGYAKGHYCVLENGKLVAADAGNKEHSCAALLPVYIDDTMLEQVCAAIGKKQVVKCQMNHGDNINETIGSYSNATFDASTGVVRADLTFMNSFARKDYVKELAETFSDDIGNSIDFTPTYVAGVVDGGKKVSLARCQNLNKIALVDEPAATRGLFEEKPEPKKTMLDQETLDAIKAAVAEAMNTNAATATELSARMAKLEAGEKEPTDEEKKASEEKKKADAATADEAFSARVEKLTLGAIQKNLSILGIGNVKLSDKGELLKTVEPMEEAIALELNTGAKSRGMAIQFVAQKQPALYNDAVKRGIL